MTVATYPPAVPPASWNLVAAYFNRLVAMGIDWDDIFAYVNGLTASGTIAYPHTYIIRENAGVYEAIDGTGHLAYGGADDEGGVDGAVANTLIQGVLTNAVNGDVVILKKRIGGYQIDVPLEITDKAIHFVGETGALNYRDSGAYLTSSTLDSDYYIKVIAATQNIFGGSIRNINFFNSTVSTPQYGILLQAAATTPKPIDGFTIENIRNSYLHRTVTLDGYTNFNKIHNIHIDDFNASFSGEYVVKLEKTNDAIESYWAPKFNIFNGIFVNAAVSGSEFTDIINFDCIRACYNAVTNLKIIGVIHNNSVIYIAGDSNYFEKIHVQDAVDGGALQGLIIIEKKDGPEPPLPLTANYGGFGNIIRDFLSGATIGTPSVKYVGSPFNNDVEIQGFTTNIILAGTAGINNHVHINYGSHYATNGGVVNNWTITSIANVKLTGLRTENDGTSEGTGAQQTIAHGMAITPNRISFSNIDDGANPYQSAAADATNIYVTAVNGLDYLWKAWMGV